jgi:hypothetical protein
LTHRNSERINRKLIHELKKLRGCLWWWLILIILITQELEMGRIMVQGQHWKNVCETPTSELLAGCSDAPLSSQLLRKA